jgi:hypothetical protein
MFWLGVLAGGGYGGYRAWRQRQSSPGEPPRWPPLSTERPANEAATSAPVVPHEPPLDAAEPVQAVRATAAASAAEPAALWRPTEAGECPDGYPVKANNSGIFHVPGGRFYARTIAERCYANAEDAVADGYRPAKA